MPDQCVLVHTSLQPVRRGDMDMLDHVNDTIHFRVDGRRCAGGAARIVCVDRASGPVPLPESVLARVQGPAS